MKLPWFVRINPFFCSYFGKWWVWKRLSVSSSVTMEINGAQPWLNAHRPAKGCTLCNTLLALDSYFNLIKIELNHLIFMRWSSYGCNNRILSRRLSHAEGEKTHQEREKKKKSFTKKMMLLLFMLRFIRVFYELRCGEESMCVGFECGRTR